jgi:hypothetical protein
LRHNRRPRGEGEIRHPPVDGDTRGIPARCQSPHHLHFTPNDASWLNQTEIWFSILVRKLLHRGNFTSKQHLQQQIESFIAYFNATMAKPFRWTMKGKPLVA